MENNTIKQNPIQTVIDANQGKKIDASDEDSLKSFLKTCSKKYPNILDIELIAKGGEAIVYRLEHGGLDEVVLKMPIY